MRITYHGYNALVIEGEGKTLIVDPGRDLHWRRLDSLIPRSVWPRADLVLVTHGDADHAEYVTRVARASGAPVVCGRALARKWKRKGLAVLAVAPGETVEAAGLQVRGIAVRHGVAPGLVGRGAVGLLLTLEGRRLLNLGDTILLKGAWSGLKPDVLMVPIGGIMTMDVDEALRAVAAIEPGAVIPVHHNWDVLSYRRPADVKGFAAKIRAGGRQCFPLMRGASIEF